MAEALRDGEKPAAGLLRVLNAQLHDAQRALEADGALTDDDIHDARRALKRARATLRLLRPGLADDTFERANAALRDAARPLTHARDARVLLDALRELREGGAQAEAPQVLALHAKLEQLHAEERDALTREPVVLEQIRERLQTTVDAIGDWTLDVDDWPLLEAALAALYRKAKRAAAAALDETTDESMHEWRKQVKHLGYALRLLAGARPGRIGVNAEDAERLASDLGDDHDLAVLSERLRAESAPVELHEAIDARRAVLHERAFTLGERLLSARRRKFLKGVGAAWRRPRMTGVGSGGRTGPG